MRQLYIYMNISCQPSAKIQPRIDGLLPGLSRNGRHRRNDILCQVAAAIALPPLRGRNVRAHAKRTCAQRSHLIGKVREGGGVDITLGPNRQHQRH